MKTLVPRLLTLFGLAFVLLTNPAGEDGIVRAATQSNTKQKANAVSEQSKVQSRLSDLQKSLKANEAKSEQTAKALQEADQAISSVNRKLRNLSEKKKEAQTRLRDLENDRRTIDERRAQASQYISTIARAQYLNLKQPPWQRFLEGANPSEVVRERASLRYLAREEQRSLDLLENRQKEIDRLARAVQSEQKNLDRITREERESRTQLVREKASREKTLKALQGEMRSQQADINKLRKDEQRLGSLIANLDKKIEAERKAAEARRQAEAAKKARQQASSSKKSSQPKGPVRHKGGSAKFASLKGKLTRPTAGRIVGRYGARRNAQTKWQGLLFQATEGADVRACADGTVVFADWLRGFGNLIIVDHGGTYMTVYANNESIFKNVGDRVKQGETISSVGCSGGDQEAGLYFELRYQGKPVNPTAWLSAK